MLQKHLIYKLLYSKALKKQCLPIEKENRVSKIPFEVATSDKPGVSSIASPIKSPKSVTNLFLLPLGLLNSFLSSLPRIKLKLVQRV